MNSFRMVCAYPQHRLYVFVQYVILSLLMTYDGVNVCGNLGRSVGKIGREVGKIGRRSGKNKEEKWEK